MTDAPNTARTDTTKCYGDLTLRAIENVAEEMRARHNPVVEVVRDYADRILVLTKGRANR